MTPKKGKSSSELRVLTKINGVNGPDSTVEDVLIDRTGKRQGALGGGQTGTLQLAYIQYSYVSVHGKTT